MLNPRLPLTTRLGALVKAASFYAFWYPRQWLGVFFLPRYSHFGRLAKEMRFVKRSTHRVALLTFHLMLRNGPKLEKRQLQLRRIVEIGTDLFAMAATLSKANGQMPQAAMLENIELCAQVFCREARNRIETNFSLARHNPDRLSRELGKKVLAGNQKWQEEFIPTA